MYLGQCLVQDGVKGNGRAPAQQLASFDARHQQQVFDQPREAVGLLFGFWILFPHDTLFDSAPKAKLPDPEILLVFITLGFGAFLGWLGARMRQRWA